MAEELPCNIGGIKSREPLIILVVRDLETLLKPEDLCVANVRPIEEGAEE